MVSFNISQLFHDDSNGCWVPLELAFIASAVVTRMRMRCCGHMAHGTSPLYTSVWSLRDLHSLGPSALGCVNSIETCTSVYNLYLTTKNQKNPNLKRFLLSCGFMQISVVKLHEIAHQLSSMSWRSRIPNLGDYHASLCISHAKE